MHMAVKGGHFAAKSISSSFKPRRCFQLSLSEGPHNRLQCDAQKLSNAKDSPLKIKGKFATRQHLLLATLHDQSLHSELEADVSEQEHDHPTAEAFPPTSISSNDFQGSDGKAGLITFYSRPYKTEDETILSNAQRNQSSLSWFLGPAVLVASFIFPSLYLRRVLSTVFEDSLLTDHFRRPTKPEYGANYDRTPASHLGQRISSVASLALSLIIPMVTMGLVWRWTGPADSATLAPYLVGIVVQFAFEQYARYPNSPSWPIIPIIFQVYRLHQLNRVALLVAALSFTVRGAEMTSHNLEISSSLGTLLHVLQILGVICIWSLSSFLLKFFPPTTRTAELGM